MPISVYAANLMCTYVLASDMYLALLQDYPVPNDTGSTLSEPAALDYARPMLNAAYWGIPSNGSSTFNIDITYLPTEAWGTIIAYALCDSPTLGEVIAYAYMSAPVTVQAGSNLKIRSGMLYFEVR